MVAVSCNDVVKGALRKLGVLASGREPRTVDRDDTFEALKGLYRQLITNGAFGRLRDVIPIADYTAYGNERIFRNQSATLAITLPETVRNWDFWGPYYVYGGIYPNEYAPPATNAVTRDIRTPRDCSVVVIIDAFTSGTYDFIYDGQTKQWQGLYDLSLSDPAPLAFRDPQGLMSLLAVNLGDDFGPQIGAGTARLAQNFMTGLTSRFSMSIEASPGIFM